MQIMYWIKYQFSSKNPTCFYVISSVRMSQDNELI